jgi:hypothetical protein
MEFYEKIEDLIKTNQLTKLFEQFHIEENRNNLNESSWDLATLFCSYLTEKTNENDQYSNTTQTTTTIECIRQLSIDLCKNYGKPKELFLVFLENSETFLTNDVNFTFLIEIMLILFNRMENTNFALTSLELALRELSKYLKRENSQINCERLVAFMDKFAHIENLNTILVESLLNLFDQPLAAQFFSVLSNENLLELDTNPHYSLFKRIWSQIAALNKDIFKLIFLVENDLKIQNIYDSNEDDLSNVDNQTSKYAYKITETAANSFFYFTLFLNDSHVISDTYGLPLVYESFYLLKTLLPISLRLLMADQSKVNLVSMGLFTIDYFLTRINVKTLEAPVLADIQIVTESLDVLFRLVIYSTFESIRKKSLQIVEKYFKCLNREARYEFLKHFLNVYSRDETLNNYLVAYLIYLFKEELNECFDHNEEFYFSTSTNPHFKLLFDLIVFLNRNEMCDVMKESSRIVACLNMIRFVLLRDQFNRTNVFSLIESSKYLEHLEKATRMAKQQTEIEYNNLKLVSNLPSNENHFSSCFEVKTNLNEKIGEPTNEERMKGLETALQKCDLIECLRVRINEIIRERYSKIKS